MMQKLKDRWQTSEGATLLQSILDQLASFESFQTSNFQQHNDRIDFRGISFPKDLRVKNFHFENVDFSEAQLVEVHFEKCTFTNVHFTNTVLDGTRLAGCHFKEVVFQDSSLASVFMNETVDNDHGSFVDTQFIGCNFHGTEYYNTLFDKCHFLNCNLNQVDFNGSRFADCKFAGHLEEVFFRGKPTGNGSSPKNLSLPNEMKHVDFSEARLESVEFVDRIDLTSCKFPSSDDYIIIRDNRNVVFEEARKEINSTWTGMLKNLGVDLIDKGFLSARQRDNKGGVIDRHFLTTNGDFGNSFFELIRQINKKVNP